MKIILLGAPGSGKGTLAKQISNDFNIPQISTGDLFRAAIRANTPLGQKVKEIIAGGGLVSDDITVTMLKERIEQEDCQNGFILDGFPRTIPQAEALEKLTQIDAIILIDLDFDVIVKRLSGRRTCPDCREIYNTNSHASDTCDKCGAKLIQRDDDKPESIKNRLEVYEKTTSPLINFYSDRLFKVSGEGTPEDTYRPVKTYLKSLEG
ncbi:MAG: adenylate kinase [Clostridia bacterium]|nr:adenylate kinase [Clostridia bacterium]